MKPGLGQGHGQDLDLDLGADLKAHRTPGVEHNGVPNNSAYQPAMPCEMHTLGPRRTPPRALGPGAVPRPRSAQHAERSRIHPLAPPHWGRWATRTPRPNPHTALPNPHTARSAVGGFGSAVRGFGSAVCGVGSAVCGVGSAMCGSGSALEAAGLQSGGVRSG